MKQHKFEKDGFGKAPYHLVGYRYSPMTTDQNGVKVSGEGNCMHCGRPIAHIYICKSSDEVVFELGCVCVEDLGDEGLTKAVQKKDKEVKQTMAREKREAMYAEFHKKEAEERAERVKKDWAELERVKPVMATMPHPNAYFASKGKTLLDYVNYFHPEDGLYKGQIISAMRSAGANI